MLLNEYEIKFMFKKFKTFEIWAMFTLESPRIVMSKTNAQNGLDFHFNIPLLEVFIRSEVLPPPEYNTCRRILEVPPPKDCVRDSHLAWGRGWAVYLWNFEYFNSKFVASEDEMKTDDEK